MVAQTHKNALPVMTCGGGIGCTLADPTSPSTSGNLAVTTKISNIGLETIFVSSVIGNMFYVQNGQVDTQLSSTQLECSSCGTQTIALLGTATLTTNLFIPRIGASSSGVYSNATLNELLAALRSCDAVEHAKFKLQGSVQTSKGAISLRLPLPCGTG
jgi:hypothetical protein